MVKEVLSLVVGMSVLLQTSLAASTWREATALVQFTPDNTVNSRLLIYNTNPLATVSETAFKPIHTALRQALLNPKTSNPFRARYSKLYSKNGLKLLQTCPMVATPLDIDNKTATTEYLIAFSSWRCLDLNATERLRQADDQPHYVLLQHSKTMSRVLAESDGAITITQPLKANYKTLRTQVMLIRQFPRHALRCGKAELTWTYNGTQYKRSKTEYLAQDCEPLYFPNSQPALWKKTYAAYLQKVRTVLAPVVSQF